MRVLLLTDIHSSINYVEKLVSIVKDLFDLCIITGDITHFGSVEEALSILKLLKSTAKKILFVPGNCDPKELLDYKMIDGEIINIHGRAVEISGYTFYGIGGSNVTPFRTPIEFSEEELRELISRASSVPAKKLVVITHAPPYKTLDKTFIGLHVGSKSLKHFLEEHRPILWVSGHIHESRGIMRYGDEHGETLIVNPGPLRKGYYAEARLGTEISVFLKEVRT